ncbi:MAG: NAD-dependent epimerase/dehydratase family protein [Legionellales bacterium]|nr:NAD-dependent epimerase/dehydratase family protein [Legionellales bacterium]
MATYLVTGGCGFIGSELTTQLIDRGHKVIVVDDLSNGHRLIPGATLIQQDITEFGALQTLFLNVDGCFHLAAKPAVNMTMEQWFGFHRTNLEASLNVFKAAINAGNVPVVYASTCGVYSDTNQFPLSEDQLLQPMSSYGCDKYAVELNAYFLAHTYQLPSFGLRLFNVYGPYQSPSSPYSGVITSFIMQVLKGEPLIIYGDGQQTRDFVFVGDVARNLISAMDHLKKGAHVVNICSEATTTINELADMLFDIFGKKSQKNYQPKRPNDALNSYGSQDKMLAYGFKTAWSLRQGLEKTVDHLKSESVAL